MVNHVLVNIVGVWASTKASNFVLDRAIDYTAVFYPKVMLVKPMVPWASRLVGVVGGMVTSSMMGEKEDLVPEKPVEREKFTARQATITRTRSLFKATATSLPTLATTTTTSSTMTQTVTASTAKVTIATPSTSLSPTPMPTTSQITITLPNSTFARMCKIVLLTLILGLVIGLLIGHLCRPRTAVKASPVGTSATVGDDKRPDPKSFADKAV